MDPYIVFSVSGALVCVNVHSGSKRKKGRLRARRHCCGRCLQGTRDIFDIDVHKDVRFLAVATFSDVAQGMRHGVVQVRRGVDKVTRSTRALLHEPAFNKDGGGGSGSGSDSGEDGETKKSKSHQGRRNIGRDHGLDRRGSRSRSRKLRQQDVSRVNRRFGSIRYVYVSETFEIKSSDVRSPNSG